MTQMVKITLMASVIALVSACDSTETLVTPEPVFDSKWSPTPITTSTPDTIWLDCPETLGRKYKEGHEHFYCHEGDDRERKIERKPVTEKQITPIPPKKTPPPVQCTMLWVPGAQYATNGKGKQCA